MDSLLTLVPNTLKKPNLQDHVMGPWCWCEPEEYERDDGGTIYVHKNIVWQ